MDKVKEFEPIFHPNSMAVVQDRFLQAGIAVSPSLQRAVKALSNVCSYYEKACTDK
jgi:hypothetical protein